MINPKLLRHAIIVAKHRNLARAAEELHTSQSTLTRSIQSLEEKLGVKLFDRGREGASPTRYGHILVQHSENVLRAISDLERHIQMAKDVNSGELIIGVSQPAAEYLLGDVLNKFLNKYPNVKVRVKVGSFADQQQQLLSGEIDFHIGGTCSLDKDIRWETTEICSFRCAFFCRKGHPILKLDSPRLIDLVEYPIAIPDIPKELEDSIISAINSVEPGKQMVCCEDGTTIRSLVSTSDTISVTEKYMLNHMRQKDVFSTINVDIPPYNLDIDAIYVRNRWMSPTAIEFIETAIDIRAMLNGIFGDENISLVNIAKHDS